MNNRLDGMLAATRLTVSGRLNEATVLLKKLVGGEESSTESGRSNPTWTDAVDGPNATVREASSQEGATSPTSSGLRSLFPTLVHKFLQQGSHRPFEPWARGVGNLFPRGDDRLPAGGQFLTRSFTGTAGTRAYKIFIPSGYHGEPVPLIVMLHGCTQSPDDFAAGTQMNLAAEDRDCIVVYPEQTKAANASKCWNWFEMENQLRDRGEPSIVVGITRAVMTEYAIDPRRVYVAGMSAGGAAAAILGVRYSDVYAAVGVHSGLACGAASDLQSAFVAMQFGSHPRTANAREEARAPAIVFHGDRDKTVNPVNAANVIAQASGHTAISETVRHGEVFGGHAYTQTLFADPSGHALIEQWTVHGAGHAWSGGSPKGSYTDPHGPDATREMLRFFLEHRRPDRQ